jgi:GNAT superfamily N-acetyltransferase
MTDPLRFLDIPAGSAEGSDFERLLSEQLHPTATVPTGTRCLLAMRGEAPLARATLHLNAEVQGVEGTCGMIGHYEALERKAGIAILREAAARLRAAGAAEVLGPIDGSTWVRYRLALQPEPGERRFEPAVFFTEPMNPPGYAEHFSAAGFEVAAEYESRIVLDPGSHARADAAARRASDAGVTIRELRLGAWDEELASLHALSLQAFGGNPYYSPISLPRFRALYDPLRPLIDPSLTLIAEDRTGVPVGTVLAFPDAFDEGGEHPPRLILKTLAVHPRMRGQGLGGLLTAGIHRAAADRGSPAVIHALMHVDNRSVRISTGSDSHPFRRYALYRHGSS